MAAWPEYAAVAADGYSAGQDGDVARTPFADGLMRQEKRFTAALSVRRLTAYLADDDAYVRFRTWATEDAHRWFAWADPEDGLVREVRVRGGAGGIQYQALGTGSRRRWVLTCELEGYMSRTIETGV